MSKPSKAQTIIMLKTHRKRLQRQFEADQAMAADVAASKYGRILGREIVKKRAWRFLCLLSLAGNLALIAWRIFG